MAALGVGEKKKMASAEKIAGVHIDFDRDNILFELNKEDLMFSIYCYTKLRGPDVAREYTADAPRFACGIFPFMVNCSERV